MSLPVWISNLLAYSLQIAILTAAGTLLIYLFRLQVPRVTLAYWQVLLAICLFVFAFQEWRHPRYDPIVLTTTAVTVTTAVVAVPTVPRAEFRFDPEWIGWILAAGIGVRLAWLGIGFLRLRSFRHKGRKLPGDATLVREMQLLTRTPSSVLLSDVVDTPVTFGLQAPVIILPAGFCDMDVDRQKAVLCHELLHIRRRDWLFIIVEETIRSFFWFHPAIWWVLGRIRLSREQAVDQDVVQLLGSRQPYLDSLLEFARARGRHKTVPAPLFLKENHLVQRVALLVKEASMSRSRLFCSLTAIVVLLIGTVRLASAWFPLTGDPIVQEQFSSSATSIIPQPFAAARQAAATPTSSDIRPASAPSAKPKTVMMANNLVSALPVVSAVPLQEPPMALGSQPIRVGGNVQESRLIYKVEPVYPELAKRARVTGNVILNVTTSKEGSVVDVQVAAGHPLLVDATIAAVRQWRYSPTLLNGVAVPVTFTVTCIFNLRGDNDVLMQMDEYGNVTALPSSDSAVLLQKMALGGKAVLSISSATPIRVAERVVQELLQKGVQRLELQGAYALYQGKLFCAGSQAKPPQIIPNIERLRALLANAPREPGIVNMIVYNIYVNEVGEILGVQRIAGPDDPEIDRELTKSSVLGPAYLGADPISFMYTFRMGM
jgi:TonB family protein